MSDDKNLGGHGPAEGGNDTQVATPREASDDGGLAANKTLRDYFAATAMQSLIAHYGDEGNDPKCASLAYGFADAMLAERRKP